MATEIKTTGMIYIRVRFNKNAGKPDTHCNKRKSKANSHLQSHA